MHVGHNSSDNIFAVFNCFFFIIFPYIYIIYINFESKSSPIHTSIKTGRSSISWNDSNSGRVLVIYVWADVDTQSLGNLQFFIRYGVHAAQPADYYFILQKVKNKTVDESRLPRLPPNAHYVQHENECYDIGTIGWFLSQNITNTNLYKYFIFMNGSVRGPFFVPYFDIENTWWFTIFIKRLTDEVKLVGCTISCERAPHVQSYLLVIDRIGFTLLINNKIGILHCHPNYYTAVDKGEIATTQLFLRANYQIASLQAKYQGWDFRRIETAFCNKKQSSIFSDNAIDGISHDPYELVFVKFKGTPPFDTNLERRAFVYQKWFEQSPRTKRNQRNYLERKCW